MSNLTNLPNIGKELSSRLGTVGFNSAEEIISAEAEDIFLRVKTVFPDACINHLYAIEGAIQGIRWHGVSQDRKMELKAFFDSLEVVNKK